MNRSNTLFDLRFYVEYNRKAQVERLNAHLKEGKSIASFLYHPAERELDQTLDSVADAIVVIKELQAELDKPIWKKLLRK